MLIFLSDMLNAEIVLGTVQNVSDAAQWLGYTYLFIRYVRALIRYALPYCKSR
jgi:pre-mRNA-splicing helicase BRR2